MICLPNLKMISGKYKIQDKLKGPVENFKNHYREVVWTYKEDSPTGFICWKEAMTQEMTLTCA